MGRTKPFARSTSTAPPHNGAGVANNSIAQDGVPQTEYYPVILNWTVQGIKHLRERKHRANLEDAYDIIMARLAGNFVKKEDLAWAMRIGETEKQRVAAEDKAKKEELKRKWAPRPMRKIKAGKRFPAAELTFLDPAVEESSSTLTEVSNVSDLRPSSRVSATTPEPRQEVRQIIILKDMVPSESASRSSQVHGAVDEASTSYSRPVDRGSVEEPSSRSQPQGGEEEDSDDDGFDEEYWANEAARWGISSADTRTGQESDSEDDDGFEEGLL